MQHAEVVEVRVLQVPVALWALAQQHTDELLREFALAAAHDDDERALPVRLTDLIATLNRQFQGTSDAQTEQLHAAAAAGTPSIDLVFQVPAAAAPASRELAAMLDEADDYCRAGQHLLTLASPEEVVSFRNWYLDQFIRQVDGAEPVAWPDWSPAS